MKNRKRIYSLFTILISIVIWGCPDNHYNEEISSNWDMVFFPGKDIRSLRIFDDRIYAITEQAGLYRHSTGVIENDWEYLGFEDSLSIAPNPNRLHDIYVINYDNSILLSSFRLESQHALYKSFDDGYTWMPSDSTLITLEGDTATPLCIEGVDSYLFAACGFEGIYRSIDFGQNWERIKYSDNYFVNVKIQDAETPILWSYFFDFFSGTYGLSKSLDWGDNWVTVENFMYISDFEVHPTIDSVVFVCTDSNVLRSVDGGYLWQELFIEEVITATLLIDPRNPNHLYMINSHSDSVSFYESFDLGMGWSELDIPYDDIIYSSIVQMEIDSVNNQIFIPTNSGVLLYRY